MSQLPAEETFCRHQSMKSPFQREGELLYSEYHPTTRGLLLEQPVLLPSPRVAGFEGGADDLCHGVVLAVVAGHGGEEDHLAVVAARRVGGGAVAVRVQALLRNLGRSNSIDSGLRSCRFSGQISGRFYIV